MFSRQPTGRIRLVLSLPQDAPGVFGLTDRNRDFLRPWLPWVDATRTVEDSRNFLHQQLRRFASSEALTVTIFHDGAVAGMAGYNSFDHDNGVGSLGYWLGREFCGQGIMTETVRDLITVGRDFYGLQKVEIRCATQNLPSRAVPERLRFTHEGTLRRAERVNGQYYDHEVYGLLLRA